MARVATMSPTPTITMVNCLSVATTLCCFIFFCFYGSNTFFSLLFLR